MIGLCKDPTGENDVALHGLQGVQSMELDSGPAALSALEAERDTLKMEVEKVHTVWGEGGGRAGDQSIHSTAQWGWWG